MSIALDLIDTAADAGADFIKFQTFKAEQLVTAKAEKALYQKASECISETQYEMLKRLEFSFENQKILILGMSGPSRGPNFKIFGAQLRKRNLIL